MSPWFRRRWVWVTAGAAVALVAFVLFWFQPQKLYVDDRVDEAIPTATPPPSNPPGAGPASGPPNSTAPDDPVAPVELARGTFVTLDHGTSGVARILDLADGNRIVRLEGLDTSNGPDLYLYLTTADADGDETDFDDEYVDLGRLKGNQGDQNYELPADADLTRFGTVVIWCDRFDSAFGAADLNLV